MSKAALSRRTFSKLMGLGAASIALRSGIDVNGSWRSLAPETLSSTKVIRLSSNENPYGPSPAALKAMTENVELAWRYPDEYADMQAGHGVGPDATALRY